MDDLISRQDAIDAFIEWYGNEPCDIDYFKELLDESPSAQQWIPCDERLPPELKPVNVTWINRQPPTYYEKIKDKPFTDTAVYYEGKWYWQSVLCVDLLKEYGESPADDVAYGIEIVAWMPLPSPYREEATDE